jgi:hypothetical protein
MKAGVKLPSVKKEEELFPAGCVESTQAVHTKKRRLTARDIGENQDDSKLQYVMEAVIYDKGCDI